MLGEEEEWSCQCKKWANIFDPMTVVGESWIDRLECTGNEVLNLFLLMALLVNQI